MFKKKLLPIYLLTVVNTFGFSILLPILPYILEDYNAGPLYYGILLSIYSVFQFFACPFFGKLSDKLGRKKILLLTQGGTFLSWIVFSIALLLPATFSVYGYSEALLLMLLARIFDGITGGNQVVANAYIADVSTTNEVRGQYATLGILHGVGLIGGPIIGGMASLGPGGYMGTTLLAAGISLVTVVMLYYRLEETIDVDASHSFSLRQTWREFDIVGSLRQFFDDHFLMHLFLVILLFGFVFSAFVTVFLWYAKDVLGAGLYMTSVLGGLIGLMFALNQFLVVKYLSRLEDTTLLFFGFLFLIVSFGLFLKAPGKAGFLGLSFLITLGVAFCLPTFKAMLSKRVGGSMQGTALGLEESLHSFNRIIAPLFAGFVRSITGAGLFGLLSLICLIPLLLSFAMMKLKE